MRAPVLFLSLAVVVALAMRDSVPHSPRPWSVGPVDVPSPADDAWRTAASA